MSYEMVAQGSGFPAVSGFRGFGSAEGDALGTSCLCSVTSACSSVSAQNAALPKLRAAMAAAGIPTSTGVWKQSETNDFNAWSRARGGGTSAKFLPDGAPCVALKSFLSAPPPAPVVVGPPALPITDCASLAAAAPPVPPGTPIETVVAVLQSLAPPGFNVRSCLGLEGPGSAPPPVVDKLPPTGGSVTTVTGSGGSSSKLPFVLLGLAAVLGLGGVAFVALSPKMRKNGGRRKKRRGSLRRNGGPVAGAAYRFQPITGEEHPLRGHGDAWVSAPLTTYDVERRGWRRYGETRIGRHMATVWQPISMGRAVHGVYVAQKDRG